MTYNNLTECESENQIKAVKHYYFVNCEIRSCTNESNAAYKQYVVQKENFCLPVVDYMLGTVHLGMGVLGIIFNAVALAVFIRLGLTKPYYVIIIFETLTDLIVCFVALYTGIFLLSDRPSYFDNPVCMMAGWLWNWNMVTTPLLLSLAGLLRIRAVYMPHDKSIISSKIFVITLCVGTYMYGATFACYPYFFGAVRYRFFEWWSICDFVYDEADHKQSLIYSLVMGPVPMCLSLIVIIVTNIIIARYIYLRYYKSWDNPPPNSADNGRRDHESIQSKQVVWSLFLMTLWYLICYSIIIFHNFKNLLLNVMPNSGVNLVISEMSNLEQTYFYATYNFCAYLNSFVNPLIQLISGNTFKNELLKMKHVISTQLKSALSITEEHPEAPNVPGPSKMSKNSSVVPTTANVCSKM